MKTLVVTEKKSVADDFAKVLGGFKKGSNGYERDDMVVSWASGHLLELQGPSEYDAKYKRWALGDLPILPDAFKRVPRKQNARTGDLLGGLVKHMRRKDVQRIINACDAGREGELIFNLILDHAEVEKPVERLWLQSMTARAIREAFDHLEDANSYSSLRDAAYARDEADWIFGMNGTRAFTKKFMGRAKSYFAVGRVKTPTLAFLVDREREIDSFVPVPYFQIDGTFDTGANGTYDGRWSGRDAGGKKIDRLPTKEEAQAIVAKVEGKPGIATEKATKRTEQPPLLFDLTSIQREASSRFGYTLDRTLSLVQSLYEAKKAVTYPRTSSRYLPSDYEGEIGKLLQGLRSGELGHVVARAMDEAGGAQNLRPVKKDRVFNDKKVSDHFAIIPTGENPKSLRDDEAKIYDLIVRRFLAVFLPAARWENVTRETVVEEETFVTRARRLEIAGWRAVEPAADVKEPPALKEGGAIQTTEVLLLEKETMPPSRYTDGSLVKAMETAGREVAPPTDDDANAPLEDDVLEELKDKGIGTPATRAAIVKDLIQKDLARRSGRNILPTPLGCTLVRIVRNLDLGVLAKPDLTGDWEYRLTRMSRGEYSREEWDKGIRESVEELVERIRETEKGNEEIFAVDHPADAKLVSPDGKPLVEKTFSYMSPDEDDEFSISKNQRGKYLFPETAARLLRDKKVGPLTGFEGTKAPGFLTLNPDGTVEVDIQPGGEEEDAETGDGAPVREQIPEGLEVGPCPKCGGKVTRQGTGYKCEKNIPRKKDKECDFRLAEKIKYRYIPLADVKKMLAGEKTDELFGFISMRGMKFRAKLYYEEGELKWEFPPRKKKSSKKKASKKKAAKKKASKKKAAKKSAAKKTPAAPPADD